MRALRQNAGREVHVWLCGTRDVSAHESVKCQRVLRYSAFIYIYTYTWTYTCHVLAYTYYNFILSTVSSIRTSLVCIFYEVVIFLYLGIHFQYISVRALVVEKSIHRSTCECSLKKKKKVQLKTVRNFLLFFFTRRETGLPTVN